MTESRTSGTRRSRTAATWDAKTEAVLRDWHQRATAAKNAHYTKAGRLRRSNILLGVPVVVFSSVVGTSLFATLTKSNVDSGLRIVIGTVSVAAAVLAALQTFLRFAERAEKHVVAADWYAALARETAELLALTPEERGNAKDTLDRVRKELAKVGQQSPEIGQKLWSRYARSQHVREAPASGSARKRRSVKVRRV
jgi:hypothetical protein